MKEILFFIVILNCFYCCFAESNNNKSNDYNQDIKDIIKNNSNSSFNDICDYSSDHTGEINTGEHIITLEGNANIRLKKSNINLRAEKMNINLSKDTVEAKKNELDKYNLLGKRVRLDLPNKTLFADKLKYCYDSLIGTAENVLFVTNNIIMRARKLKKHFNNRVDIKDALFTTCKHRHPKWGFFIKKGTYYKDLIIANNVRFMFGDKIFPIPFPFIYKIPVTKQSGFVYPTSIWYNSDYGFTIDPGFYWYISECADVLIRCKFFTGGQIKIDCKHNYYVKNECKNTLNINLSYNPVGFYFYFLSHQKVTYNTNLDVTYHYETIQKKKYNFKADINMQYRDNKKYNKDQEFQVCFYHNFDNIFFLPQINISNTYNKIFKTGKEEFNFIDLSIQPKGINIGPLAISSNIMYKMNSSNKEVDYILEDENDKLYKNTKINLSEKYNPGYPNDLYEENYEEDENDDKEVNVNNKGEYIYAGINKNKFSCKNWKDYFTKQYWLNVWNNLQTGVYIPINISSHDIKIKDFLNFNFFAKYDMKFYTSILKNQDGNGDKYEPNFIYNNGNYSPYFLHMFHLGVNCKLKKIITILKNKVNNILNLSLTYNPSSDDMQVNSIFAKIVTKIPFLRLEKAYVENNKGEIIDLFSHTIFGNMTKYSQLILSGNWHCNIINFINFNLDFGYDFLANYKDTFPLKNITLKFGISNYTLYEVTWSPYKYVKIENIDNNDIINNENDNNNIINNENDNNIINNENDNNNIINNEDDNINNNIFPNIANRNIQSHVNDKKKPKFKKTKDIEFSILSQKLFLPFYFQMPIGKKYNIVINNILEIFKKYNPVYDKDNLQGCILSIIRGQLSNSTELYFRMQIYVLKNKYPKIKDIILTIASKICDCWQLTISIQLLNLMKGGGNILQIQFKAKDKNINMLGKDFLNSLWYGAAV